MPFFVGITGASGSIIGTTIAYQLSRHDRVFLCFTKTGYKVAQEEAAEMPDSPNITLLDEEDLFSPISSGSFTLKGTIIAPCSMGTLGRIANGISSNLIERAADVALKERRWPLILVPRETPLNIIHLENMLKLAKIGVHIVPPVLTFYHRPQSVEDMVNFIVGKILDILGIEHSLYKRWGE